MVLGHYPAPATLMELALEAYDKVIGLRLSGVAVDCCLTKASCGGEKEQAGSASGDQSLGSGARELSEQRPEEFGMAYAESR